MLAATLLVYEHLAGSGLVEHWPYRPNSQQTEKFKAVKAGQKICYPACAHTPGLSKLLQGVQTVNLLHNTQELQNMFLIERINVQINLCQDIILEGKQLDQRIGNREKGIC